MRIHRSPSIATRRRNGADGMFLLEALLGTFLTVTVATAVILCVGGQRRAAIRMAETRRDITAAENALAELRTGHAAPAEVAVQVAGTNQAAAPAPAGWEWVTATAGSEPHRVALTGLVPIGARP